MVTVVTKRRGNQIAVGTGVAKTNTLTVMIMVGNGNRGNRGNRGGNRCDEIFRSKTRKKVWCQTPFKIIWIVILLAANDNALIN